MYLATICVVLLTSQIALCQRDSITFPGGSTRRPDALGVDRQQTSTSPAPFISKPEPDNTTQIPLDEIRKLNEIDSVEEFLEKFGLTEGADSLDSPSFLTTRFGEPRNNQEIPKLAKCEPEMTIVSLQNTSSNDRIYFPRCTRLLRCGGCCNSGLLSCQPTSVRLRNFQVYTTEYTMGRLVPSRQKELVTLEEHTKCSCACVIKPQDCNSFQEYRERECSCKCINHEDRQKCESDVSKIWDYNSCMCRCRDMLECSTGFFFDENTCSCKPEPVVVRFGSEGSEFKKQRRPIGNRYGYVTSNLGRLTNNQKTRP